MFWERQISIPRTLCSQQSKSPQRGKVLHGLSQWLRADQDKTPNTQRFPK